MSDANWLWPIDGKSFYDINNNNYLVHIDWSKNSKEDYQKLSQDFFECGYKICEKIVDSGHDNIKSDMWFFPTMYLFRHGMELGLKALICGAISENRKIQQIFLDCKHDLYMLFDAYERETAILLTEEEYGWMKKYLHSLEEVDAKSDFFRFPLEDEFLLNYQNKFLDIVDMMLCGHRFFYNLQTMDLGTAIYGNQSQEMDFINWCWDIVSLQNSCSVNVMKYQKKRKCFRFSFC